MSTVDDLNRPAPLKYAVWVHFAWGREKAEIVCAGCEIARVAIGTHLEEDCLNIVGHLFTDKHPVLEGELKAAGFIIPCRYVTYVTLGPELAPPFDFSGDLERMVFIPGRPPAPGRMSVEAIRASLAEFKD